MTPGKPLELPDECRLIVNPHNALRGVADATVTDCSLSAKKAKKTLKRWRFATAGHQTRDVYRLSIAPSPGVWSRPTQLEAWAASAHDDLSGCIDDVEGHPQLVVHIDEAGAVRELTSILPEHARTCLGEALARAALGPGELASSSSTPTARLSTSPRSRTPSATRRSAAASSAASTA